MRVPFIQPYADIGVAAVNKIFARVGWIFREQPKHDLGIDAHIEIVESGISTGQLFGIQIKTGRFSRNKNGDLVFYFNREHRSYWLNYSIPVLVVLYEIETNKTYWSAIDVTTVKATGKGGYKVSVLSSNQLTYLTAPEIQIRLFDKVLILAMMAFRRWTEYRIIPEAGELFQFFKKIQIGKIPNELLAFLLCSAHLRREEIEDWCNDNEKFSMNHFFCHLYGNSLLCSDSSKELSNGIGDLGGGTYLETPDNFIGCLLFHYHKEGSHILREGLHIYIVDIDEPEIIYKPTSPDDFRQAWEVFDTCIGHLIKQRLSNFHEVIDAV